INDLQYPKLIVPSKGCCFRLVETVTGVDGRGVKVHVSKEDTPFVKGWEKDITVQLAEGMEEAETGGIYVLRVFLNRLLRSSRI
ncbi:hypothetical protein EJ02DRAFT_346414, partial [Clathrospora elynae]